MSTEPPSPEGAWPDEVEADSSRRGERPDSGFYECYGTCNAIKDGHALGEGVTHCIENDAIEKLERQYADPIQRCSACASVDRPAARREWFVEVEGRAASRRADEP